SKLVIPPKPEEFSDDEIRAEIDAHPLRVVAATVGEDEHSVGMREIIDIKHGGIERYGIESHILGTSISVEKLVDAAIELDADAVLTSTIISHDDMHYKNMKKLNEYAIERGVRDKLIFIAGGTQVSNELAVANGMDAGFGRGTNGSQVATFLVKKRREMKNED
ncbi:MAG: LuxR family transcriptional regulator, partial [Tissierellia bacterium]|nr:LuxR family transcriptional regulator [Tissierellia bacterium]